MMMGISNNDKWWWYEILWLSMNDDWMMINNEQWLWRILDDNWC